MPERTAYFHGPRPATDKFPNAVKANGFVFTSGHVAIDDLFEVIHPNDCSAQADIVFQRLEALLAVSGTSMDKVVKITCYLANADDYLLYNEARHRWFPENPPASTTVVCELVKPGLVVEIEAVALAESAD